MPLPRGMDVGNIPKVLKVPYKNEVIDLEVNYFYALEPENYISNHGESNKTTKSSFDMKVEIDTIDTILTNLGQNEDFINGFRGSPDGKCDKIERFPSNDFRQEDQVHLENDFKCVNAVLEVNYKFFWRANQITRMIVNVLLGNLTLIENQQKQNLLSSSQFQELHQIFSVDFQVNLNVHNKFFVLIKGAS